MSAHARCHAITASLEGGRLTAADAAALGDPGGATRYGISQRLLDSLGVTRASIGAPSAVAGVTPEIAERIGHALFWEPSGAADLWESSPAIALAVYDCAFQSGPSRAAILMQRALGVDADGVIGHKTIAAAQTCTEPLLVALDAIAGRRAWLAGWAAGDPKRAALLRGLHHRCDAVAREAVAIEAEYRHWDLRAPIVTV